MKEIENIFSRKETKKEEKCPNPNVKIIVDTREKQSLIAANLREQKANISFEKLEIGDYLIGRTIIERKTFPDFLGSMLNKRLQEQLINLKKYEKHFLIIEGFGYNYNKYKINENAIRGMILSIATDFKIPIIFTADEKDTSKFLVLTAKKYENKKEKQEEFSIRQTKNLKSIEEQKKFILEGFPGIGPNLSKKLLERFGQLNKIFSAKKEELSQIEKFDENKINKFKELLEK